MNESKISVRYSKALFELAKEQGVVKEVRDDMKFILELSALHEVKEMLASPVIENSVKRSALIEILKVDVHDITLSLVALSVKNNRESFLPGIARCYIDMADKYNGITKASLTTATRVSDSVLKRVSELIEKRFSTKVEFEEKADPEIGGGFILKVEDRYIDASVRTQLRRIKKELTES